MRSIFTALAISFFSFSAYSADVICSCKGDTKCSDIKISFVPSNPGVYMTIEYAYGDTNTEGFATIITDNKKDRIIYRLDKFTMVEKDGKFELPGRPATCN